MIIWLAFYVCEHVKDDIQAKVMKLQNSEPGKGVKQALRHYDHVPNHIAWGESDC